MHLGDVLQIMYVTSQIIIIKSSTENPATLFSGIGAEGNAYTQHDLGYTLHQKVDTVASLCSYIIVIQYMYSYMYVHSKGAFDYYNYMYITLYIGMYTATC